MNNIHKDTDNEIWKSVGFVKGIDFTGLYEVSNFGNVKSLGNNASKKEKILKCAQTKGYKTVIFRNKNVYKTSYVHRLVATLFKENIHNLPQVNHIDGNKLNNHINNLEWCTSGYNIKHAWTNELTTGRAISVVQICLHTHNVLAIFKSASEAQRQTGIYYYNIIKCCNGERKTAGKFKWKYL